MGADGLRNSGEDSRRSKLFDRLVNKAERGRCRDRKTALRRWGLSCSAFSSLMAGQNEDISNMREIYGLHCDKRSELASSAGWDRTPPVEGFTSGSRRSGLCKRFGNAFA